ncbi:polyhydroxybutyrate depolymerase [Sphingomonas naasensis]|uniref:Polyhydroxybutyrate depolymerase n=1 Tax=Sphingomonas naasensis TaxID=1344951 RepID=A0A4S1WEU7_9SPHN|nr:PHB depolymerase family esterase [Sphingomonas naasensis]NIJ21507.1 polyhydroxybutyrate depolymerase [Sphingomonas naasensis]TGX41541.1 polyhydroxybutyrate depolymerase [Sphingomonas naasensis]
MRGKSLGFAGLAFAAAWAPAANASCTLGAPGTTQRIAIGATGRAMLLRVPAHASARTPLVFVLHGSTGDGAAILAQSKLEATADRHGFLLAAPDGGIVAGKGYVWNIPGVPTVTGKVPGPGDADDVAWLGATIDWLAAQGCVDRRRVYATGLSGGGRMSSWLGCVAADRFAAIAPVVGLRAGNPSAADSRFPDPATCAPSKPMPVIAFAGDKDTTNPIEGGGAGYWQYPMRTAEARWADLNGCRRPLAVRTLESGVVERGHTDCRGAADVIARITPGAGHVWTADNEAMWAFFARHRR